MKTLRFHEYGEPATVLQLEEAEVIRPPPNRIRVLVHACGLNPADWVLCRGLLPGKLPRGVGFDVAGIVDAVGEGVTDIAVGDRVFGQADYAGAPFAGAGEVAILDHWARVPESLDLVRASALPVAIETAFRSIDSLGVSKGQTLFVHGAGTMMGYAAVQMAVERGAQVIASAGSTFAEDLRKFGAKVVAYGEGLADRVLEAAGGPVTLALDTAPPSDALPALVRAAGGDPKRVLTITDFDAAEKLGVRTSFTEGAIAMNEDGSFKGLRYDVLGQFVEKAAAGRFTIPIARMFPLADWRTALEISLSRKAHGKLVLLPR